jgi:hypothetical protein
VGGRVTLQPFTLPPTRAVGNPNPPGDMNQVVFAALASGAAVNVLSTAFDGGADATGTNDSSGAFNAATGALSGAPGYILVPGGSTYKIASTVGPLVTGQYIVFAPGVLINWTGTGDCFHWVDTSTYTARTTQGGGIIGRPIIDGTSDGENSRALHAGDILGFRFDVAVQNFANTGDIAIYLDNQNYWTEQARGIAYINNCTQDVVFNCGGADTSAGSFDRGDFTFYISHKTFTGNVFTWQNGAYQVGGMFRAYGNINSSADTFSQAVLSITGSAPAGHPASYSGLQCGIDINVESDEAETYTFQTINFGSTNNTISAGSFGGINFGSGNQFTESNVSSISTQFVFLGPVVGDSSLQQVTVPDRLAVNNQAFFLSEISGATFLSLTEHAAPSTPSGAGDVYVDTSGNLRYLGPGGQNTLLARTGTGLASSVSYTPADPTGTTSGSLVMMGMGTACTFTPGATGIVPATITAAVHCTGTAEPMYSCARYGTGTAPTNGAAATGTKFGVGADTEYFTTSTSASEATPVTFQQVLSLTPGTAYWFDLALASSNVAGTAVTTSITATFTELAQ